MMIYANSMARDDQADDDLFLFPCIIIHYSTTIIHRYHSSTLHWELREKINNSRRPHGLLFSCVRCLLVGWWIHVRMSGVPIPTHSTTTTTRRKRTSFYSWISHTTTTRQDKTRHRCESPIPNSQFSFKFKCKINNNQLNFISIQCLVVEWSSLVHWNSAAGRQQCVDNNTMFVTASCWTWQRKLTTEILNSPSLLADFLLTTAETAVYCFM